MKESRESHLEKTYRFIVEGKTEEKREQIYAALELLNFREKMPSFFFRNPLFHWAFVANGTRVESTLVEETSESAELRHVPVMDYVLSTMKVEKGKLVSKVKFLAIEELLEKLGIDEDAEKILREVGNKRFTITMAGATSFPVFSTIRWNTLPEGEAIFVCSDEVASMYLFDSLVSYRSASSIFKETYKNNKIKDKMKIEIISMFRFLSYYMSETIPMVDLSFFTDKMSPPPLSKVNESAFKSASAFGNLDKLFKKTGIEYDKKRSAFVINGKFIQAQANEYYTEDILNMSLGDKYIDFGLLSLNAKLRDKGESLGIPSNKIEFEFERFKEQYKGLEQKYMRKSTLSTWANYIRKKFRDGEFDAYKKDVKNKGPADNIEYTEEMKKQSVLVGISEKKAAEEFLKFQQYMTARQRVSKNWIVNWQRWLGNINAANMEEKENEGDPVNITLNKELLNIGKSIGINEGQIETIFKEFKSRQVSIGRSRKTWVPEWEIWATRAKGFIEKAQEKEEKKYNNEEKRIHDFKIKILVSEIISRKIGLTPEEASEERMEFDHVEYISILTPPGHKLKKQIIFTHKESKYQQMLEDKVKEEMQNNQNSYSETVVEAIETKK